MGVFRRGRSHEPRLATALVRSPPRLGPCLVRHRARRPLAAQVEPEKHPAVAEKSFRHADLDIAAAHLEVRQLPATAAGEARGRLNRLGVAETSAFVDQRGGRFVTLMPATPLLPGRGDGNRLTWGDLRIAAPKDAAAGEKAAYAAFESYLRSHRYDLGIDPAEIGSHNAGGHGQGATSTRSSSSASSTASRCAAA